jgi:phage terminase large subunit
VQLLIRDATLWRDAQAKAKAAATRPVPPVQRPGVSQPKGAAQDAQIQHLTQKLEKTGNLKDAAALLKARRAGAR